jgi:hypothetical protein
LNPDFGGVLSIIHQPDGKKGEFAPIICKLGLPEMKTLQPSNPAIAGYDPYSESVKLSYGANGSYLIRIGNPINQADDRLA